MPKGIFIRPAYRERGVRKERVLQALRLGPASTKEIALAADLVPPDAKAVLDNLERQGLAERRGKAPSKAARNVKEVIWGLRVAARSRT